MLTYYGACIHTNILKLPILVLKKYTLSIL